MNQPKRSYIAMTMVGRLAATTIVINLILLLVVGNMTKDSLRSKEEAYLTEIVSNISNNISTTIHEYVAIAEVMAMNGNIKTLLEESDQPNPMHQNSNVSSVIYDIAVLESSFSAVLNVAVMDIEQDGYLLHNGGYSDSSFSFKTRDYYSVVTTRSSMITQPYLDVESGGLVISTAAPVINAQGTVLGAIVVDLSIDFIADLVATSHFGQTGDSVILDGSGLIMGHSNKSYVGQNYNSLSLSGSDLERELSSPSKTIVNFTMAGEERVGEVGRIGDLDWVLLTSINAGEFNAESNAIQFTLFTMLMVSVAVTLLVVVVTVVHSLKPLMYIKDAMAQLSSGNLHYRLDYASDNEIGELADNLRVTMSNLAKYIDEIQRLLNHCGDGDFTVSSNMEFIGDFAAIQTSIDEFIKLISEALGGIKATVEQVTLGSDYVASGSQNLADGSVKQSDSVQELNLHITEISEKVNKNVETVQLVNKTSQEMTTGLLSGNERMKQMVASMEEIARTSEGIQKIVKTIEEVAFQTNILALNAAVEAARAGTTGRGFAVVAEEVRNLATRTSVAVQETTTLITETVSAVEIGSENVEVTAKELNQVIVGLDGFMKSLGDITNASQEQAVAIGKIHNDVNAITSVMQTNSAISEESAATSQQLSSQAAVMKETISQFRTHNG